jgi:hypothetical protein
MSKEKILDEYRKKFGLCDGSLKYCGCKKELDFISKAIDQTREETIKEVEKILPEKRLGQVNNEGFCEDCHYKLCRCSEFNYLIDFIKQSLKSLINK